MDNTILKSASNVDKSGLNLKSKEKKQVMMMDLDDVKMNDVNDDEEEAELSGEDVDSDEFND